MPLTVQTMSPINVQSCGPVFGSGSRQALMRGGSLGPTTILSGYQSPTVAGQPTYRILAPSGGNLLVGRGDTALSFLNFAMNDAVFGPLLNSLGGGGALNIVFSDQRGQPGDNFAGLHVKDKNTNNHTIVIETSIFDQNGKPFPTSNSVIVGILAHEILHFSQSHDFTADRWALANPLSGFASANAVLAAYQGPANLFGMRNAEGYWWDRDQVYKPTVQRLKAVAGQLGIDPDDFEDGMKSGLRSEVAKGEKLVLLEYYKTHATLSPDDLKLLKRYGVIDYSGPMNQPVSRDSVPLDPGIIQLRGDETNKNTGADTVCPAVTSEEATALVQGISLIMSGGEVASFSYGDVAVLFGNALGRYLGGDDRLLASGASTILGAISMNIGQGLEAAGFSGNYHNFDGSIVNSSQKAVWADFGSDLARMGVSEAIGSVSSYLSAELGQALGLQGFGAELFQTGVSSVLNHVVTNLAIANVPALQGLFPEAAVKAAQGSVFSGMSSALGSSLIAFFATKLGSMVVAPHTQAAVALSSIGAGLGAIGTVTSGAFGVAGGFGTGGVLGTWVTSAASVFSKGLGNLVGQAFNVIPGLGIFVGFVLGALIGNLFGRKKPKTPTASAETVLQVPYARYELGAVAAANGGNIDLATGMAETARDVLNGLIDQITHGRTVSYVSNAWSPTQRYGHTGSQIYVKLGGVQYNVASADEAVDKGVLWALPQTQIIGGDIFLKRVVNRTVSNSITALVGDLQIASDYADYRKNHVLIDAAIAEPWTSMSAADKAFYTANRAAMSRILSKDVVALSAGDQAFYNANKTQIDGIIASIQLSPFAASWIITLQRATELGLDKFAVSDFYGGLRGFLDSFDLKGHGANYEDIRIYAEGDGAEIQSRRQTASGLFSLLGQSEDGPGDNDVLNARFQDSMQGWDMATWQVANPQRGVNLNADWSGSGNDVFWMHMPGTPVAGSVIDVRSALMVSSAGVVYESSVKAAQHRGLAQMYMEFYDANMNHLGSTFMSGSGLESGSWHGDIANFNTISGTVTAPPGTAYRRMVLRLAATGGEVPFGFFTQPTSRVLGAATTTWEDEGEIVRIEDMSQVGYAVVSPGATTSGNDLVDQRLATGGVVIDDNHEEYVQDGYYYYNGWDYEWIETSYLTTVEGGSDIFVGGQGGDYLYGRSGWDWLDGRGGNDWLEGGEGADVLIGRDGDDTLLGQAGDDYLAGGNGTDGLDGGAGNDILVDGQGSEVLQGGDGDDTFLIAEDATFNWFWGGYMDPNSDPNGKDTISAERLTFGVAFDLDYRPPEWNGNPDVVAGNPISRAAIVTNAVTGAWVTSEGLLGIENATGSEYADRLYGTAGDNVLKGLAGDDQLYGREGNDILEGGLGADLLVGGGYYDTVSYEGSAGAVYVDLSTGETYGGDADGDTLQEIENVRGSLGADQLKGNFFHNRIEGLAGDDWIAATNGEDVYDGGGGVDFVDYSTGFASGTSTYEVWVEDGYWEWDSWTYQQVWVSTGGHYENTTTTVAALNINLGSGYAQVRGADGTVSNHILTSIEGVLGTAYDDTIGGGAGAETFAGGAGNDYIYGGGGADTYVLDRGDGSDTIVDDNSASNTLMFGDQIKYSDLTFGSAGGANGSFDFYIRGTGDAAHVVGNFATRNNNRLKAIDMNGAGQLFLGSIDYARAGSDWNDTIHGSSSYDDFIAGYNGDDYITGSGTAWETRGNVIIGGLGNDTISTSGGDDQFAYDRGDGVDTIIDAGGEDTLVFGSTVAAEDVIYEVVGNDLYIAARNLSNTALTASQVADRVRIQGGGVKYVVMDGYSNTVMYESLNTVEYVLAGGTSIDMRKLSVNWTQSVSYNYDYGYPIALDLDGDGLNLSAVDTSEVVVRTAGGGVSRIGWVGPTDGFLAVDRDGDGAINKLSELSFVQDKPGATSDLEGLRTWDSNGDGLLDRNDKDFSKILLFVDANQNGRSTAKELRTLEQAGIVAINLGGQATGQTRELTTESFVQNTISFVWADGRTGEGYDVALARRVLGSVGYDAGQYQAEWGAADEDGELGRLSNDPKAVAKAARIHAKKGLLEAIGASYDEVKSAAQLDFSDNDRVDASIAKRWKKMNASEQASWLSGQQPSAQLRLISAVQSLVNGLNAAAQARQDVVDQGYAQAAQTVNRSGLAGGQGGQDAASVGAAGLGVGFGAAGLGLSLAAGEPLETGPAYGGVGAGSAAWWREETGSGLLGGGSLAERLAAMDAGPGQGASLAGGGDPDLVQRQALLRQAMAGFGGQSGGGAAVWTRDAGAGDLPLAASAGLKAAASRQMLSA